MTHIWLKIFSHESSWDNNHCCVNFWQSLSKFTKRKIHSKWPVVKKVVVLSGNSFHFVNFAEFCQRVKWVRKFYRKIRPRVSFLSIWWVSQSRMSAMLFKLQLEACKCFKGREILVGNCGVFLKATKLKSFQKNNKRISLISTRGSKKGLNQKIKALINP